jgi:hypothetical protein
MTTTLDRPVRAGDIAHLDIVVCRRCADDLEHCHDTLVVHGSSEVHCTASECTTPTELHALVIGCDAFDCDCAPASAVATGGLG